MEEQRKYKNRLLKCTVVGDEINKNEKSKFSPLRGSDSPVGYSERRIAQVHDLQSYPCELPPATRISPPQQLFFPFSTPPRERDRREEREREEENEREEHESHTFPPRTPPIYNGVWPIICLSKNTRINI